MDTAMEIAFEADGWRYEMLPKAAAAERCGAFEAFKRLWDLKRAGRGLPAWRDYVLQDFEGSYGWAIVEDIVSRDPFDTRFRLWGTKVAQFYNMDLTKKRLREFEGVVFTESDIAMRRTMARTQEFRVCSGPVEWTMQERWKRFKRYGFIQMPLADDGEIVDRFITLCRPEGY